MKRFMKAISNTVIKVAMVATQVWTVLTITTKVVLRAARNRTFVT